MKYMGSKARFANELLPIILNGRDINQYYVEPFVGGCNMIDKVGGNRIAADNNKYLIALWVGLQDNREKVMNIPKELYNMARDQYNGRHDYGFDDYTIGWIGFMASFNGRFFGGGYSGVTNTRDYIAEQIKNTMSQIELIKGIEFNYCEYDQLKIPHNSIVYCDIPYHGTKEYDTKNKFNHDKFWDWCRLISKYNTVYISEYSAPDDFVCVWEKDVNVAIRPTKTISRIERLYVSKK